MEAEFIYLGVPIAGVIVGLLEIIKKSINPPTEILPIISLILGLSAGIIAWVMSGDLKYIFMGLLSGMGACGAYDTIHKTRQIIKE